MPRGERRFLLRKKHAVWLLASSTASLALLVGALTVALPAVEAESSARPVAQALMRARRGAEPLLTGPFLARGIIYYTHTDITAPDRAVRVLAKRAAVLGRSSDPGSGVEKGAARIS